MQYTFNDLLIGDMFNTMSARWVKTSVTQAISVMSTLHPLGTIRTFYPDKEIVLLYSTVLIGES